MTSHLVTIVVVPRERFSFARESLESIYTHTRVPFSLVYVDGNSPPHVRDYLAAQAKERGFTLVRTESYLPPNRARNLGLERVHTPYVVFVDNDVAVSEGWLEKMLDCAEQYGATVVTPLTCIGTPLHRTIHCAGGDVKLIVEEGGRRRVRERMGFADKPVEKVRDRLERGPTRLAEFHCVLVRTAFFERYGRLDEQMLNTREHIDFSLGINTLGEPIYFEPEAVVTYVPGPPLAWSDLHYYMLRWSDAWEMASLTRFREKWDLSEDEYFKRRYRQLGWRRQATLIQPLVRGLAFGRRVAPVEAMLSAGDRALNRFLTDRHATGVS
jgi:GT2 family glycosyltransferase